MPNTQVLLDIKKDFVHATILIPLQQLDFALQKSYGTLPALSVKNDEAFLRSYFNAHLRPTSLLGKEWQVTIDSFSVISSKNPMIGTYDELVVNATLVPPDQYETRKFIFDYDAVIHQVVTHNILVSVRQDWMNGIDDSNPRQIGTIQVEIQSNQYHPLVIDIQHGSSWKAFLGMIHIGLKHISHGTDHLLFMITLLLPSMLVSSKNRWGDYIGYRASAIHVLKIITAFTIGHSLTLAIGAMHLFVIPVLPIEILIAVTILFSAIHSYRPIYSGKEVFIAGGFGLIHGMAFAEALTNLQLDSSQMALSILGFNIGIECMQLLLILFLFPGLILLNKTKYYSTFRQISAAIMIVMALAWMVERIQGQPNIISKFIA